MGHPKPTFQITLAHPKVPKDLTASLAPRLQSLNLSLSREKEADQLDLVLHDADSKLAIPKRGAKLSVALGWQDNGVVPQGAFIVDEVEHSGPPDSVTLRARSASMTGPMHERREQSWHEVSLGAIVQTIAVRYQLVPKVGEALAKIKLAHIDQTHESDLSFLTRLAHRYDALMTVKQGVLLFMPIGALRTTSGQVLPRLLLTRQEIAQHRYHVSQRESYAGVRAYYHHRGMAQRQSVIVGAENRHNLKVLPEQYASQADAAAAARAEWQRVQRSQATLSLTLTLGREDVFPEMPIQLKGFKPEIDHMPWLIARVTHTLDEQGYITTLECEVQDDPATARHRRTFRQRRPR